MIGFVSGTAEICRHTAPANQDREKSVNRFFQRCRVVAHMARLSEHLVHHRIERGHAPYELTALGLRIRDIWTGHLQHAEKSAGDPGCQLGQ